MCRGRYCRSPRDRCGYVFVVGADLPDAGWRQVFRRRRRTIFDDQVDLNELLIKDITSTYVVRVSGDSVEGAGISNGDELIVTGHSRRGTGTWLSRSWTGSSR